MRNFKQQLKGNSVFEVFVEKFPYCQKIHETLVACRLKRCLIGKKLLKNGKNNSQ